MSYQIHQGIIIKYSDSSPRNVDLVQIPDFYTISNCRLPRVLKDQTKPLEGSIVFFAIEDGFKSYIISVIREPKEFLTDELQLKGSTKETKDQLEPGEIFMESRGDPLVPGLGSTLELSNNGTVEICSGKQKECLIIGGEDSDDDQIVILQGDNGELRSNIDEDVPVQVQSIYQFDEFANLKLGNDSVLLDPVLGTKTNTPLSELTMDIFGNVQLRNAILGVSNVSLDMKVSGEMSLKNTFGELKIDPVGKVTLENLIGSMEIQQTGNIKLTGPTIDLNNGTFGVARLNDIVTSDLTTDPAWWLFWSTLSGLISAIPTVPLDGGATLKVGLASLFATIPVTIISKITSASTTVKAGG